MIYQFSVFSNRDIGLSDQNFSEGSFTLSGSPRAISVLDDDPVLDDENGVENDGTIGLITDNESWDSSKQTLTVDVDGMGVNGHVIQSVYVFDVVNSTTGETGKAYMLRIYDTTTPGSYSSGMSQVGPYYYAFTIPMEAGDSFAFSNGQYIGQVAYSDLVDGGTTPPICYLAGTRIATPQGEVEVERLNPGQEVMTRDGIAELRWLGVQRISLARQIEDERLRPIRIAKGALGHGTPLRDLFVSQQHRVLVASPELRAFCGSTEVLVPACHLLGLPGITRCAAERDVLYVHFLCDRHEIVFAEGAPCETLLPGKEALKSLTPAARRELELLLPHNPLTAEDGFTQSLPAARILSGRDAKQLARHYPGGIPTGQETSQKGEMTGELAG